MTIFNSATGLAEGSFGVGTYQAGSGKPFPGLVLPDGTVFDLSDRYVDTHAIFDDWDAAVDWMNDLAAKRGRPELRFDALRALQVVAHPNMMCAGSNYRQHVAEMMTYNKFNQDKRLPGESDEAFFARNLADVDRRAREGMPFFWTGLHSSLCGANDEIPLPLVGEHPDWELEFGAIIHGTGRYIRPDEAGDLIAQLERQIAPFDAPRLMGRRVTGLQGSQGAFTLTTDRDDTIRAKAVVIAAGAGAFGPNRPPLDGLPAYEATGAVQYYVRRREDLRGKRVVIAGGGDSAVDWALALKDIAKVSVIHRRPKFRAAPETAAQLDAAAARGEIEMVIPYQLHALHGEAGKLTHVEAATLQGETKQIPADVLLPFFGLSMDLGPIAAWGLALERNHLRIDPASCATSTPGIFAIGDIAHYPGKLKLILQGFSEAAMAAHAIHPIVHPDQALHFEYSTTKGVPGG